MKITGLQYVPAPDNLVATGLLGWASFVLDGQVRLSGIGVRTTRGGRMTLSFPFRDDGFGWRWTYIQPVGDAHRVALEREVLRQIEGQVR